MKVTIVGSGICGLTTALALQSQHPTLSITIIADKFNSETTSFGAAGIFRPGGGLRSSVHDVGRWINESYHYYNELMHSVEAAKAGVFRVDGYLFSTGEEGVVRNKYLEKLLPVYRSATKRELRDICCGDFKHGAFFQTMIVDSMDFMKWATLKFKANGGTVIPQRIENFQEIPSQWIINCTGLAAKWLCNDDRVIPIRGQVFKVKAPWVKMFYYGDFDTYIIPGKDTITLGGCRNFDSYNEKVDEHDSQSIWKRCTDLLPNLAEAEVVKEWVGLRPYRDEVRVEFDSKMEKEIGRKIIHNYGHGGYGVTSSPGTALEVVRVFSDMWRKSGL